MHALVTGGGGFLGRYIVEQLLARGDRVRVLARDSYPELVAQGAELARGDLRHRYDVTRAVKGVDCVFHVAGKVGIGRDWRGFYEANVVGTENVIAACRQLGVGRLVFTSSPSVTFDGSDQCGVDEGAPYPRRWLAHYPRSKALAEQRVLAANGNDLRTCALRPHLVWGPRDHHLTARLIERARRGRLRRVGDRTNLVDMIYVENAAQAHLQAADALAETGAPAGKPYFLSQGEPVNCWEWVDQILALVNLPPVGQSLSYRAAWRLGAALEWAYWLARSRAEPPMTRFLAAQLATSHWFDISAALRDFGYEAHVSTAEGMRRLAQWLHAEKRRS
jgi:nucleoside-diphosphate-sugar epimerase